MNEPQWLIWARKLQAIAQNGLTTAYGGRDPVDLERYREVGQIAAEITARHSDLPYDELLGLFDRESGYATPKVAVRAAIFQERTLLLVKEKRLDRWTLPGGYADVNEAPSQAVAREVLEESGYAVRPTRLLAVYDSARSGCRFYNFYHLFFDCELVAKVQEPSPLETSDPRFFPADALPPLVMADGAAQIARLFQLHDDPHLPPDFD